MADVKAPQNGPLAVDKDEARRLSGLSDKTLKRRADEGHPVGRFNNGRRVLYHLATLEAYLAAQAAGGGA